MSGTIDYTILSKLIYLPAYQNQGTLVDYLDPWIGIWTPEFLKIGLSKETLEQIKGAGFEDPDEIEDIVKVQADIVPHDPFCFENDLLLDWTKFIADDPVKLEIIKKELHDYFFWKDEPAEFFDWQTEEGMPRDPGEAVRLFQEIFGV